MPDTDPLDLSNKLSIIVPVFNEEPGLERTLLGLRERLPHAEIIVVDDGSTDRSAEIATAHSGIILVRHDFNQGYGRALKSGMKAVTRNLVGWFDGDNQHRPEDLAGMLESMEHEPVAAILGQRDRSAGTARALGKFVIWLLAISLNVELRRDVNCGLRIFKTSVLRRYLHLLPNGFSASMTSTMVLLERGYPIRFHPIIVDQRIGSSKVRVRDGFRTFVLVLRTILLFSPLRFFLPIGVGLAGVGTLYGTIVAVNQGLGFPILAALLVILGMLIVVIGLVADQISQIRLNQIDDPEISIANRTTTPGKTGNGS